MKQKKSIKFSTHPEPISRILKNGYKFFFGESFTSNSFWFKPGDGFVFFYLKKPVGIAGHPDIPVFIFRYIHDCGNLLMLGFLFDDSVDTGMKKEYVPVACKTNLILPGK